MTSTPARTVLFCASALVAGIAIGGWIATEYLTRFYADFLADGTELRYRHDASARLAVLASLRAGRPDAAALQLEQALDADVLSLDALVDGSHHRDETLGVMRRVAEYRAHGEHVPEARLEGRVQAALARAMAASAASR